MTIRHIIEQTDFKTGIIDPNYIGQTNNVLYQHGARALENFEVKLEGTITRRPGMRVLKKLPDEYQPYADDIRLVSCQWSRSTGAIIIIKPFYYLTDGNSTIIKNGYIDIYDQQGERLYHASHSWNSDIVKKMKITDTALGTLLCHEDLPPTLIISVSGSSYQLGLSTISFERDSDNVYLIPFASFDENYVMSCSAASGHHISIKTTRDFFIGQGTAAAHSGTQIKIGGGVIQITNVLNKKNATARVIKPLTEFVNAYKYGHFSEQVFSKARGYPRSGTTYQGRLIFGGSKYFPNKIWMSKLGLYKNFDIANGDNNDAISFNVTADQAEEIEWLVPWRYLEIYTNLAEWSCPVAHLTPTNIGLVRQGHYGITHQASAPPLTIENRTIFLGSDQKTIHQLQWSDINKAYEHFVLNEQAKTLTQDITALHYDATKKMLYGLKQDGSLAVMTYYQEHQIFAWHTITTLGKIVGIANGRNMVDDNALLDQIYFLIKRGNGLYVETFTNDYLVDGLIEKSPIIDRQTPIELDDIFIAQPIALYQDGQLKKTITAPPADTPFTLPPELALNKKFSIGLIFSSRLKPLHRFSGPGGGSGFSALKLARLSFLVKDTSVLCWQISDGKNFSSPIQHHIFNPQTRLNPPYLVPYSGWASFILSGWRQTIYGALWQLYYQNPYPLTLLSVKEEYVLATLTTPPTTNH
ncbi:MAG: hypothetical protein ACR2NY_01370 [Alphaproteobacteria bacterium]